MMLDNNYEKAYFYLFNAITDSIHDMENILEKLKCAQCETEEIIIRESGNIEDLAGRSGGAA